MGDTHLELGSWTPVDSGGGTVTCADAALAPVYGEGKGKPVLRDWHPTTIPDYESPFRLAYCLPQRKYTLFRHGEVRNLPCCISLDEVRLGCTYIDNSAIREMYWWSNASPVWLRWIVRVWDGWKRRPQ